MTIGRSSGNAVILRNRHVGRRHCVVEIVQGAPMLRDLESRSGTFVNGVRIVRTTLRHGDRVSIGPFDLVYKDPQPQHGLDRYVIAPEDLLPPEPATIASESPGPDAEAATPIVVPIACRQEQINEASAGVKKVQSPQQPTARPQPDSDMPVADSHGRIDALRQASAEQAAKIEALNHATAALQKRNEKLERQQCQERDEAQQALAAKSAEIAELQSQVEAMLQRLRHTEATKQAASDRAQRTEQALGSLRTQIGSLDDAARQVASLQDQLAQFEEAWVEADQMIQAAEVGGGDQAEQAGEALEQRQALSAVLEALTQQRDAAFANLNAAAQRLRTVAGRTEVKQLAGGPNGPQSPPDQPQPSPRRWWRFGSRRHV